MTQNQQNQILDHTFNNGSIPVQINPPHFSSEVQNQKSNLKKELNSINRDVNKLEAHLKSLQINDKQRKEYLNSSLDFNSKNRFQDTIQSKNLNQQFIQKSNLSISPYNYYGQSYRFQKYLNQLKVQPVILQQRPKTQCQIEDVKNIQFQTKTQCIQRLSRIADTGCEDPLHYKFPNQKYYIYFQDQARKNQVTPNLSFEPAKIKKYDLEKKPNRQKMQPDYSQQQRNIIQKSQIKPNWFLEKKITRMEKQIKQLKKKQQQREKSNKFKVSKKNDSKINISNQVERMINSLWP